MSADVHTLVTGHNISKAGALLHSLAPRAQKFCFYDHNRDCIWSSDDAEHYDIDSIVADLSSDLLEEIDGDEKFLRRTMSSGETILALPVPETAGLLVALFSRNDGKSSSFDPKVLAGILNPAVALIGENVSAGNRLCELESRVQDFGEELELVYEMDQKIHGASGHNSSLAQLVGRSGRHLGIKYSVLLIPAKRIRIRATHSSWKNVNRRVLDSYLTELLMPKLEGRRSPTVFKIPVIDGSGDAEAVEYRALLCPVNDKQGNVEGILAHLGRVAGSKFSKNERRFALHIARKVETVIEQSFDPMTGLMTRNGFEAQIRESCGAHEGDRDRHQLIYFDLDNLQLVIDSFSREAGDEVILSFARMLEEDLPKSAVLSRLTGDDFGILLTHADAATALEFATNVLKKSSSLRYLEGDRSIQITTSIGIAEFDASNGGEGKVLTTARMACEAAKEHGGDRIEIFNAGNHTVIRRYDDMQLVAEIQQAIDGDEFELVAQPIASLSKGSSNPRFEILLRMDDGDGDRVQTGALFSAAERYRMMPQIDRWVVSTTIAKLTEVYESVTRQNAIFAINLSGQSLGDDDFLEFIEQEIDRGKIPESSLCFEITESAAVSNLKRAQAFIDRLRQRGCHISLDDFGAGLSSFAYLKNFNVDTLKIDGGFIRDITSNRISESMVAAITQVAKVMELKTVAEYVETEEAKTLISELGVDFAQGHLISKPIPLDSVLSDLSEVAAVASK